MTADRWVAAGLFAAAALTPVVVRDSFILDSLILILLWGALSSAWNVAGGYAGQVSLGHAAFFGIGAYAAALTSARYQQSPWLGLVVGVALSLVAASLSWRWFEEPLLKLKERFAGSAGEARSERPQPAVAAIDS